MLDNADSDAAVFGCAMMISIILSAAALNSSLPLTCPTGSKRTNWIAVIATMRCKASMEAYSQCFNPEWRMVLVSRQSVDVLL